MGSKAQIGTFEELLEITEEALRPVVTALREVVFEVDPDTCEVVRLGDRAATYGVGPRKMLDGYAYTLPYKRWVKPRVLPRALSWTIPKVCLRGRERRCGT